MIKSAVAEANSNIALIKYWGKRDEKLHIPVNSSISMTLDDKFKTITNVSFSTTYKEDKFILNGKEQEGKKLEKVKKHLDLIREIAKTNFKAKVTSHNSFPTGTGIASSASGFAALTAAACKALNLVLDKREQSRIARLGSGSATRSFYSGFVEWKKGEKDDGMDSYAVQLEDNNYWKELRDIVVIVSQQEKDIGSREGMQLTVKTSSLYKNRIKSMGSKIGKIKNAINQKNKEEMFNIIMEDSDSLHLTMLDTKPALRYLNKTSKEIIKEIRRFNLSGIKAAYSFDAGPNAHIITTSNQVEDIKSSLNKIKGIKRVIVSRIGEGVRVKDNSYSVVKAYGKVLVYGGYSILEGGIGLVVNVDKGTTTKASFLENNKIEIKVKGIENKNKLIFAESAVKIAREYLKTKKGIMIESVNDKEMNPKTKAGFGSSATATVSIIAAILDLHRKDIESEEGRKLVYELSSKAHRASQGKLGSGFDISAACFGTQFFSKNVIEKTVWPENWNTILAFTGKSASTVELVKKVNDYKRMKLREYSRLMEYYNKINSEVKDNYKVYIESKNNRNLVRLIEKIEKSFAIRKKLGKKARADIETKDQTKFLDSIKKKGAIITTLPGAGAGDTVLAVCEGEKEMEIIKDILKQNNMLVFENINIADKPYEVLT